MASTASQIVMNTKKTAASVLSLCAQSDVVRVARRCSNTVVCGDTAGAVSYFYYVLRAYFGRFFRYYTVYDTRKPTMANAI